MAEGRSGDRVGRRPRVVVVGAGVAGLTAARALRAGCEVVVVDKGRGVGGRLATRRIGDASLDHGAQFLTTHTEAFAATVAGWRSAGVVRPWYAGRVGPTGVVDPDGHPRYRGVPAMSAVAKHLAAGLDVRLGARVVAVRAGGGTWAVDLEGGETLGGDALVLTAPVPQTLELLAAGSVVLDPADGEALAAIRHDPCLAVLAPLAGPSGLPEPGAVAPDDGPIDWIADNRDKGVSPVPAVTIHATASFSRAHRSTPDDEVVDELVGAAGLASPPVPGRSQVHRWRYARPTVVHHDRCLVARHPLPLVLAGDAFGGAKVEGAALSGAAAGAAVAERW